MTGLTRPGGEPRRLKRMHRTGLSNATLLYTLLLLVVGFVVLYPVIQMLLESFRVGALGQQTTWGLENWRQAFAEPHLAKGLYNTLTLTIARQSIALVLGVAIAWAIARTNLPGRNWLEFGFWLALLLPPLPTLMGWILLLDSQSGLINQGLMKLPFIDAAPFNIFSWWGIVFVHLVTGTLSAKVFLLTPAFRNMEASLEDASRTCGASTLGTLWRIVVPVMLPAILVVTVLGIAKSLQAFEVELILGTTGNIEVFSTLIYRSVKAQPPQIGMGAALGGIVLAFLVPLILLQQWLSGRRSHATVTGKFATRLTDLGRWRWPLFTVIAGMLVLMLLAPITMLIMSTFMKIFGHFELPQPWTLANWQKAFGNARLFSAIKNTLILGGGAAAVSMVLFSLTAYVSVRTRFAGRKVLDFLTWLPTTLPGIVISLGFLWMFLSTPVFRPFYGTIGILIVAVTLATMTTGVQVLKSAMIQLGAELEEASWVTGASALYTFWRVVMPLIAPSLVVVALQVFASAVSQVGLVSLLGTPNNLPLSLLQLDYMESGSFGPAAVTGVFIMGLTMIAAIGARIIGLKAGVGREH